MKVFNKGSLCISVKLMTMSLTVDYGPEIYHNTAAEHATLNSGISQLFFPQMVKNLPANAGDMGSIPGSGRSSGRGNGYPL